MNETEEEIGQEEQIDAQEQERIRNEIAGLDIPPDFAQWLGEEADVEN